MINRFQKAIWEFSSSVPLWLGLAVYLWLSHGTLIPTIITLCIALILSLFMILSFKNSIRSLSSIDINVIKVSQSDGSAIAFIVSYFLPFGSLMFEQNNLFLFFGLSGLIYIIMIKSNFTVANPLFLLAGYHFYDIESDNGVGNYLLITKKSIRNRNEISNVYRVTEYFLIMKEENNV